MNDDFRNMFRGFGGRDFDAFFHHDINRMFQEMDEMMKAFNFGNFNMIESPNFHLPIEPGPENENRSLRDNFLKNPNDTKFDEDLDEKIRQEGFDKVVREDLFKNYPKSNPHTWNGAPQVFTSGQSCSIRRIQRPDGSIEEVKTIRNSDGKEEKTVTRIIGDKSHSIIEKKSGTQIEETEEVFNNFDEQRLDDFNKMWNNFPSNKLQLENPQQQPETKPFSVLSKLFSWLK